MKGKEPIDKKREQKQKAELVSFMLNFAFRGKYCNHIHEARSIFWANLLEYSDKFIKNLISHPLSELNFFTWLLYGYLLPSGKRFIDIFIEEKRNDLTPEDFLILEKLKKSHLSLYQVEEVLKEGFIFKDLFSGEKFKITEKEIKKFFVKWDILATDLIELDGEYQLNSGFHLFSIEEKSFIINFLEQDYENYKTKFGEITFKDYLKNKIYIFNHIQMEMIFNPEFNHINDYNKGPLIFSQAQFKVIDFEAVRDGLTKIGEFEKIEDKNNEERFRWSKKKNDKVVLGILTLGKDLLFIECNSKERLELGKKIIIENLSGSVSHRSDMFQYPYRYFDNSKRKSIKKTPRIISKEVEEELMKNFFDEYYLKWLDKKKPALNWKTPMESAKSKKGKELVINLLKNMENSEQRKKKVLGQYCYDFGWLWEKLGFGNKD